MPAPKKVELPASFTALRSIGDAKGERRDCTVIALSIACNVSYDDAHRALAEAGRKSGKGAHNDVVIRAIEALGYTATWWSAQQIIDMVMSYPKKGIAGITTHQPRRFPKQWAAHAHKTLLLRSHAHISAYKDGIVQDWAINRAKQVWAVLEITKKA